MTPRMSKRTSLDSDLSPSNLSERRDQFDHTDGLETIKESPDVSDTSVIINDVKMPIEKRQTEKKTQDLTNLYEFDPREDPDPFYEINSCHVFSFMETFAAKTMNQYIKVEKPPVTDSNEHEDKKKEEKDPFTIENCRYILF